MREMKDSGVDWIGAIPKDWDILNLKYVASLNNYDEYLKTLNGVIDPNLYDLYFFLPYFLVKIPNGIGQNYILWPYKVLQIDLFGTSFYSGQAHIEHSRGKRSARL